MLSPSLVEERSVARSLLQAAALVLAGIAAALALGRPGVALGLGVGYVLGSTAFLSWAWILGHGTRSRRHLLLAAALGLGKLFFYSALLYLVATGRPDTGAGVAVGVTAVAAFVVIRALRGR